MASLSLGSAALMHFRPHVNMDNLKAKNTLALTLILRHVGVNNRLRIVPVAHLHTSYQGDVLIMDGDGVQKYYESVI